MANYWISIGKSARSCEVKVLIHAFLYRITARLDDIFINFDLSTSI